ncbi:MAG: D-tyrosyl-tRNA(Tyr) deacylase [Gammaproteobacteria bacterium]|nr:MAG: D-tyrosyl-tRNA(Tyr) deacylase [Gammaproteobacteria bacterium]
MIALLQRVSSASVVVNNIKVAEANAGVLVFLAVQKQDTEKMAEQMQQRILSYRMFADDDDKMNKNICEVQGDILLVPQFTLAADTTKGLRPNFSAAATPDHAKRLFDYFLDKLKAEYARVSSGKFAADMQVHLVNNGPVTFWLEI